MAREPKPVAWADEWVRSLPHPESGEDVYPDPDLNGHRLVVRKTIKTFEIQRDRPKQFGPRKTYKIQTGDALTTTVEDARAKALIFLGQIRRGLAPTVDKITLTRLGEAWDTSRVDGAFVESD